ncbi:FAD-binding oxidoreductase [Sphingomonas sp. PL-96]|uniref:FAD-binding oxidoreductase n=1 Tax=Sphingomonas sp. PL-96 TaxID=2887201 RepID=UPI001E2DFCC2|nr:FAD-binding oxidoreductase [Sphingomonas sp. PL-96]MCC2975145.1 FAD-binding oxidoreductase [Sphingomonas sp. PL-96]
MNPALAGALADAVGPANLLTDPNELAGYASDGRGVTGRPLGVVRPSSAGEVAAVLRAAHAAGVRVVPQGARTGLVAAAIPGEDAQLLLLNLDRLSRAPAIDPVNRTAEVDAGVRLSTLNAAAAPHQLSFPIDLGADPSIGGMIAANTGGARLLRYGDVRRNLLALELVTSEAEPRLLQLGAPLWKNNTGIDLKQLLVGSSGSLGVVTRATLALSPLPAARVTAMLALDADESAVELLLALEASFGTLLTAFEGISAPALSAALTHVPRLRAPFAGTLPAYAVLIELSAGAAIEADWLEERLGDTLAPWMERGTVVDAVLDRGDALWAIRHAVPEGLRASGKVVACDIALRRGDVMRFRRDVAARVKAVAPQLRLHDFGHVGDGGLHFNLVWPPDAGPFDATVAEAARATVFRAVVEDYGGSFSAEHGIGPSNAAWYTELVPEPLRHLAGAVQRLLAPVPVGRVDFHDPISGDRA